MSINIKTRSVCNDCYETTRRHSIRFGNSFIIKADTVNASRRHSYTASEKIIIVDYALKHTQAMASNKYGIHKSMVSRWVRDYRKIHNALPGTKRIGSGPGISQPGRRDKSVDSNESN
jgi:transposase-like protein